VNQTKKILSFGDWKILAVVAQQVKIKEILLWSGVMCQNFKHSY
jgi:hypothetical protein